MSDSPAALREDDAMKMLVCETHLGSIKADFQAEQYKNFKEPRLLIVSDPLVDHQAITEASYVNIPVISFCNTDSPLKYIDIGIPCNNKNESRNGKINRQTGFVLDDKVIMPDLYFYRDPQEQEKEDQTETRDDQRKEAWGALDTSKGDEYVAASAGEAVKLDFQVPHIDDWAAASTWEQPGEVAAAPPPTQPAAPTTTAEPAPEWGAGTGSW
ncbi:ribosomal protein s2 domain-containing protein [Ditylenchus destructor]|nr:ribosomal protein s2 domain-containing protein [Ditylenchus destructor]